MLDADPSLVRFLSSSPKNASQILRYSFSDETEARSEKPEVFILENEPLEASKEKKINFLLLPARRSTVAFLTVTQQ